MTKSKLSIITPSLNRVKFIVQAVESVQAQDLPLNQVQHIIIDGGSTDGTLELLHKYPHLKVISEHDNGLYDAINKGVRLADGEIIGLLNTDDLYTPNIFGTIIDKFNSTGADAIIGSAQLFEEDLNGIKIMQTFSPINWQNEHERWERLADSIIPNAWFFRRNVFTNVGLFDPSIKIMADREFLWRIGTSNLKVEAIEQVVYWYRSHADSLTMGPKNFKNQAMALSQIKLSRDFFAISEKYISNKIISRHAERSIRYWYAEHTYILATIALYHFYPVLFFEMFRLGSKYDLIWFFRWFLKLAKRINREIRSKFRIS
jgi:glycosyltransferase involved in cell wall biosynthesis